jgi:hypothetical protein
LSFLATLYLDTGAIRELDPEAQERVGEFFNVAHEPEVLLLHHPVRLRLPQPRAWATTEKGDPRRERVRVADRHNAGGGASNDHPQRHRDAEFVLGRAEPLGWTMLPRLGILAVVVAFVAAKDMDVARTPEILGLLRRRFQRPRSAPRDRRSSVHKVLRFLAILAAAAGVVGGSVVPGASASATVDRPSSGRCAGVWNTTAPPQTAAFVVAHHVRQATATVARAFTGSLTFTRTGGATSTGATGFACALTFVISPTETLSVIGQWHAGTVSSWGAAHLHSGAAGSGNACVAVDGTIHRVGRFDARVRCA